MQAAMIWFKKTSPEITLETIKNILEQDCNAKVEYTSWQLESFVVPQLKVTHPLEFLIQLNTQDVNEEAKECSDDLKLSPMLREKLASCDVRLECGDDCDTIIHTENSILHFVGETEFDPAQPEAFKILSYLAQSLGGIFDDNVNGRYYHYDTSDQG